MRSLKCVWLAAVALGGCAGVDSSRVDGVSGKDDITKDAFEVVNLVSDQAGVAPRVDPDLVNAWGIAIGEGDFWIADNGTGKISIYDADGNPSKEYPTGQIMLEEGITGIAANATDSFIVNCTAGNMAEPADFIVASESGKLWGINANVDPRGGTVLVDRSSVGASYKGVAIASNEATGSVQLLAADFHNGRIDVFDKDLNPVVCNEFQDANLPEGFAPFNVAVVDDKVFVAYAEREQGGDDEVAGPGLGLIDEFDISGRFIKRVAMGGSLNAPWGMAMAPVELAQNALVVGNFGDGHVTLLDVDTGRELGQVMDKTGAPIAVDGLWGITFGNGKDVGKADVLYFAAGPGDEQHGLFGRIQMTNGGGAGTGCSAGGECLIRLTFVR